MIELLIDALLFGCGIVMLLRFGGVTGLLGLLGFGLVFFHALLFSVLNAGSLEFLWEFAALLEFIPLAGYGLVLAAVLSHGATQRAVVATPGPHAAQTAAAGASGTPGHAAAIGRTPAPPISKGFHVGGYLGGFLLGSLLLGAGAAAIEEGPEELGIFLAGLGLLALLFGMGSLFILVHRMWSALEGYERRTTPGAAVGLLFIPLFNLYWSFQVFWGWTVDYNRAAAVSAAAGRPLPPASEGLALTICTFNIAGAIPIVGILLSLVNLILYPIYISRACDGVNALRRAHAGAGS